MGMKGVKIPGSGRKKGTPNKDKRTLAEIAAARGSKPFEVLLMISDNDWKGLGYPGPTIIKGVGEHAYETPVISLEARLKASSDACNYLHPKLKQIDVKHSPEDERPYFNLTDEQILSAPLNNHNENEDD